MTHLSVSEARKRLFSLIDDVAVAHRPVVIAGKRNSAVLVSEEDWRAIQETLHLVSVPGMVDSICDGLATPHAEMAAELEW